MSGTTLSSYEWTKLHAAEEYYANSFLDRYSLVLREQAPNLMLLAERIGMQAQGLGEYLFVVLSFTPESYALWQLVRGEYENPEV